MEDQREIKQFYKLEQEIGKGSFAKVRKAIHKKTGERVAVKVIDKNGLTEDDVLGLYNEIEILKQVDHPNIVKLYDIFEDDTYIYLVMELMLGGELFDVLMEKHYFSEREAAETILPIIDSIKYCHSMNIIHRDIKPENILYSHKDLKKAFIKVSDFGLARFITSGGFASTTCGTPGYVAPEIVDQKPYGKEVDYWSIGVVLYILLCGYPPFYDEDNGALFQKIRTADYSFPSPVWDYVSEEAKNIVRGLLVVDPKKRLSPDDLLKEPWILGES